MCWFFAKKNGKRVKRVVEALEGMDKSLRDIREILRLSLLPPPVKVELVVEVYDDEFSTVPSQILTGIVWGGETMASIIKATGRAHVRVKQFLDAKGNVTTAENLVWSSGDDALLGVTPDADTMGAWFAPVGPVTPLVQGQLTADPVLGTGEGVLTGIVEFQVIPGDAAMVELEVDVIEDVIV